MRRVEVAVGRPPGWALHDEPAPGVVLALTGPERTPSGLPPTVTVGVEQVAPGAEPGTGAGDPTAYVARHRSSARDLLTGVAVEEEGLVQLTGRHAAYLRLAHTLMGHDLSAELWTWLRDGTACTVTATVDRELWPDYSVLFERIADSCRP